MDALSPLPVHGGNATTRGVVRPSCRRSSADRRNELPSGADVKARSRPTRAVDLQQPEQDDPAPDYLPGPDDPGRARRLVWAELFKRVWHEDVLRCPRCGGHMRLVAVVKDPAVVCEKILRHLGLWQRGPPRSRHVVLDLSAFE